MDKYTIAKKYLEMTETIDTFVDKLPQSIQQAFFDNEFTNVAQEYISYLLTQLLTESQLDDLYYFAHETCPIYYYDDIQFTDLFTYWTYRYNIE